MNCPKCGRAVISRYKFCGFCGASIHEISDESSELKNNDSNDRQIDDEPVIIVSKPQEYEEAYQEEFNNPEPAEDESSEEINEDESNGSEVENIEASENNEEVEELEEAIEDEEQNFEEVEALEESSVEPLEEPTEAVDSNQEVEESPQEPEQVETVESEPEQVETVESEPEQVETVESESETEQKQEEVTQTKPELEPVVEQSEIASEKTEEPIQTVIPAEKKAPWISVNGRMLVKALSTIAFLLAFAAVAIIIYKDYKSVLDDTKSIYKVFKGSHVKFYYQATTYLNRLFAPAILVIGGLVLIGSLFKGLASYKKDTTNESTTVVHITYSISVAFAFVSVLLYRGVYDKNYIDISFYMCCGALAIIAISSIVEAVRQANFADRKAVTIFKSLFDFISSAALITAVILLMKDFFVIKYDGAIIGRIKISQIDTVTIVSYGNVSSDMNFFIESLAFTVLFTAFIISISRHIGTKISMENGKRKIPYIPALLFILMLVVFDCYSNTFEKSGLSLFADQVVYYVILALAVSSLVYMFRQILFDIDDKKNKNLILKRLGATLMFAVSIAMILSYTIDGFSNQRLYFYNIINNVKSVKTAHIFAMQIMTILMFIVGVKKILASFENSNVEEAHTNAAHGVSLVFAAFFVSAFFKFVDAYELDVYNKPKLESSEILCFIIYSVLAILMILFALNQYKKSVKQLICAIIEVAVVGAAIVLIYRFRLEVLGGYVGFMAYSVISNYHLTAIAITIISLVLIILLSEKLKNLLTLNEVKNTFTGITFLALLLYVLCVVALYVDIYDENAIKNIKVNFKQYKELFTKLDYVPAGILFVEMILAPILKQINKPAKQ